MSGVIARLKGIPVPIWIGLGLVLLLIFFMSSKRSGGASGPVTDATVGSQGSQVGAGTDQALGNLSQITQSGFTQIKENQEAILKNQATLQSGIQGGIAQSVALGNQNQGLLQQLLDAMSGVGTGMQQFGGAIQSSQNSQAASSAATNGTPVANHSNAASTSLFNVPIVDASGGAGTIQVVARDADSAYQNAFQGGNTPTGPATAI